ncbi:hypothetical protein B0H13DRAFT_1933177 [Mycena leptocephala]|nr:hypothetical protein B0H13DRAFT_1933177 [Mycena leptocephala]
MTLAHQLQHLDDIDVCAMLSGPWDGAVPPHSIYLPLIQYVIPIPPQYGQNEYASGAAPARLPGVKINFITPTFQRTHRMSSTLSPCDSRCPAGTAPSDLNRDEPIYGYVDACGCVWLVLRRLRSSILTGSEVHIAPVPHLADARLPAVFSATSVFDSVRFLPPAPVSPQ